MNNLLQNIENKNVQVLKGGENAHQYAELVEFDGCLDYQISDGKELSYNDILDVTTALNIISEFSDVASCAFVKHSIPCGVALGTDIKDAYLKAFDCNSLEAMSAVVAFSQIVTKEIAMHAYKLSFKVVVAPDFEDEALNILQKSQDVILIKLKTPFSQYKNIVEKNYTATPFGLLAQDCDKQEFNLDEFKVATKTKPTQEQIEDMIFAFKIAKFVKSTAVVIVKDFKTLAISAGFLGTADAAEFALNYAVDGTKNVLNAAAQGRISAIIQPGGSKSDENLAIWADKLNMSMVFTGIEHIRH